MKKLLSVLMCTLLVGCASTTTNTTSEKEVTATSEATTTVDTKTGASSTRTVLSGDDLDAAVENLEAISNDLATKAETEKDGYEEPESEIAQVLSVNDDGTPAMSTIHAWKVEGEGEDATITVVMTDGRTISNLIAEGAKGTILIHGDAYYLIHVETKEVTTLEYSEEAYEAGEFNSAYSGASNELNEYTVTFTITDIESTQVYMFD